MTTPTLDRYFQVCLPAIEEELRQAVAFAGGPGLEELHGMLAYHMGWEGENAGPNASGKRIRPLLVLLACAAAGGDWTDALPGAAAVELVHNFSLIHDDIEDNSDLRRGRPTVWKIWGIPQAINAGDAMYRSGAALYPEIAAHRLTAGSPAGSRNPAANLPGAHPGAIPRYLLRAAPRPGPG